MKREMMAGATLLLALAGAAAAQETASAPVTATVEAATLVTVTGTTDFGTVPGYQHHAIIDPKAPGPNQSTARFSLPGLGQGFTLFVRFPPDCTAPLTRAGGSETMSFVGEIADGYGEQQDAIYGGCIAGYGVINAPQTFHIWLGGRLLVNANQTPGSYAGTFPISVEVLTN